METQVLSFQFIVEHKQLILKLDDAENLPSEKQVRAEFSSSEYNNWYLENEVEAFLEQQNKVFDAETTCILATCRDAELTVTVSKDNLQVTAEVVPSFGGLNMSLGQIKQACLDQNIKFGLKSSLTNRLLEKSQSAEDGVITEVIGKGKPAIHGEDAYLKPLVPLLTDTVRSPQQNEDGSFDLKDLGAIISIAQGTPLAEKVPATKGTPGMDVYGEYLEAKDGQDFELKSSDTVLISTEDPNQLVAKVEGIPRFHGNHAEVDNVFNIAELTPKEGHIKFSGSVIVQGDVFPDMKIEAKGDVVIGGFVESSNIQAHGDITILGGVSGKIIEEDGSKSYSCNLTSGGSIEVAFANQCQLTAKHLVSAKKQLSHCDVTAYSVRVGSAKNVDGQVIGGIYRLCKTLDAGVIGNDSFGHVDIDLNRTYNIFLQKEADLWLWIEEKEEQFAALETTYDSLPMVQKDEFYPKVEQLANKIERYRNYRKQLMAKRREYMEQAQVRAHKTLYPNVSCFITEKAIVSEKVHGPSQILVDEYEVKIEPLV